MSDPTSIPTDRVALTPSRSDTPDLPAVPTLPAIPKPTAPTVAPPKPVASDKPPVAPPAATPTVPPPPQPRWVREALIDLIRPNRNKGLVLAAAASLIVGATAMNTLFTVTDHLTAPTPKNVAVREIPEVKPQTVPSAVEPPPPEPTTGVVVDAPPLPEPTTLAAPNAPVTSAESAQLPPPNVGDLPPIPTSTALPMPQDVAAVPLVVPDLPPPNVVVEPATRIESDPALLPIVPVKAEVPAVPVAPLPVPNLPAPAANKPVPLPEPTKLGTTQAATSGPLVGIPDLPLPVKKSEGGLTLPSLPPANTTPLPVEPIPKIEKQDPNAIVITPTGVERAQASIPAAPVPPPVPQPAAPSLPVIPPPPSGETPKPGALGSVTPVIPTERTPVTGVDLPKVKASGNPLPPAPTTATPSFREEPAIAPAPLPSSPKPIAPTIREEPTAAAAPPPVASSVNPAKLPGVASIPSTPDKPQTDFDVDLYMPKSGDTYETISKRHYGDARYAGALRAFNRGQELSRGQVIHVPPMYVLRQRYAQYLGVSSAEPARGVTWEATAARSDPTHYVVPRNGMSLWDVAQEVYRDRQQWKRFWDANPQVDPNADLPAGTRLILPSDARASR